ncbi:hypothetical protein [Nocardioides marmoribigeumensis]|uniref:Uncharacterized protein n=1 Tax=Nocardioides marmoribigeumensis TaxID=433649 RepID=A0ABU2BSU8_9ACTN|nr:hypothetical protein [Nocardioides marmoribigeumensis]MDR7360808.1 hypothetical protein [Nocardioides marmoribigeumensis]
MVEVDVQELVAVEVEEPLAPVEGRQQHPGEVGVEGLADVDVARPVTAPVVAVRRDGRGARLLREPRLGPGVLDVRKTSTWSTPAARLRSTKSRMRPVVSLIVLTAKITAKGGSDRPG